MRHAPRAERPQHDESGPHRCTGHVGGPDEPGHVDGAEPGERGVGPGRLGEPGQHGRVVTVRDGPEVALPGGEVRADRRHEFEGLGRPPLEDGDGVEPRVPLSETGRVFGPFEQTECHLAAARVEGVSFLDGGP